MKSVYVPSLPGSPPLARRGQQKAGAHRKTPRFTSARAERTLFDLAC